MPDIIPTGWSIVGIGDFNGDGISDILLRSSTGEITDWLGQADGGGFVSNPNLDGNVGTNWHVAGTGDFTGDGTDDVLWTSDGSEVTDWIAQNSGFVSNTGNAYYQVDASWHVAATGDFNGDGRADILWRSDSGRVINWLGQTNGGFVSNVVNFDGSVGTDWTVAGAGDFNGDGRTDVLWRSSTGEVTDWLGQASGAFASNFGNADYQVESQWHLGGIGDFNGDGRSDLLWRNDDGTIIDWLAQANGGFVNNSNVGTQHLSTDVQIAGVGDFNGDGRTDVLIRSTDGTLEVWTGETNGYILSPAEKHWQEALANVSAFFDEINNAIGQYSPNDQNSAQNSYYGGDPDPMAAVYYNMFEWNPVVQTNPTVALPNFLLHSGDPVLDFLSSTTFAFSAQFGTNFGSMTLVNAATNEFILNTNGTLLHGTWHADVPPPAQPSEGIVVTGYRNTAAGTVPTGYFSFDAQTNVLARPSQGFSNGGGAGGQVYATAGASLAANFFADMHITNLGATAADEHAFELAHNALANFYDWVEKNPSSLIDIGHGLNISAAMALLDLNRTYITLTDKNLDQEMGAFTQMNSSQDWVTIKLNPQTVDFEGKSFGWWILYYQDPGENFTIFHEIGHALNDLSGRFGTEPMANTAAFHIMQDLQMTTPPPPGTGFDE